VTDPRRARLVSCVAAFLSLLGSFASPDAEPQPPAPMTRGCPPERAPNGEVRLVFLGDSGYGTGAAEWEAHAQESIAAQLADLRLPPDLVFFLGDNVYWYGSASLYKTRFDDMYDAFIRQCKVHVTLGNHDVKGCRAAEPDEHGESLPGDATAYEDIRSGHKTCNAAPALAHAQFGFGTVEKGGPRAELPQRYYSLLWPLRQIARDDAPASPEATTRPLVQMIVLDSNTLGVAGGVLEKTPREDRRQLVWLRNAMAQCPPAPGEGHRIWKILAMHHPPYTPRSCLCRLFGHCLGGHADETLLQEQLREALEGLEPPDIVMTAHNHIYARSLPLNGAGQPIKDPEERGIRYFVSGGGGGPLYALKGPDARFAKAITMYHFLYFRLTASSAFYWALDAGARTRDSGCFEKGSGVDHPLSPSLNYDDPLPPRCAPAGS
jgi:hypothetical protein